MDSAADRGGSTATISGQEQQLREEHSSGDGGPEENVFLSGRRLLRL
jgi:hypothetical protein